ncbi:hypothetical protein CN527_02560 [Bacillus cereus]|nr:hypothetical protein CN527_02560 [Bacillus cereus]
MAFSLTLPELHTFYPKELKYIEQTSGLYLLYSSENELLYIGKSVNLKARIIKHFKGGSNVEDYVEEFEKIECYYIDDELEMDLSETFLINTLRPKYNKNKYVINKELKNKNKRGYRNTKKPPFEKETLVHLRKERGLTLQQIADALGCTNASIHKYLSYYEIETEKTVDIMRKHFINCVMSLKTKDFFKIDDVRKSKSFDRSFYNILHEHDISKLLEENLVYRLGSFYYKSDTVLNTEDISELKICSKCEKILHVNHFHKQGKSYKSQCKVCRKNSI